MGLRNEKSSNGGSRVSPVYLEKISVAPSMPTMYQRVRERI